MSKATRVKCCEIGYDTPEEGEVVLLCPLHARAPALRDALKVMLDAFWDGDVVGSLAHEKSAVAKARAALEDL